MIRQFQLRLFLKFLSLFFISSAVFQAPFGFAQKTIVIVSGGGGPISNHSRYYKNIDRMALLFPQKTWQRIFLVADGRGNGHNLFSETSDNTQRLQFERQDPTQVKSNEVYLAATKLNFRNQLLEIAKNTHDRDPVYIYVTDHGGVNETTQERTLLLWGESLQFSEFTQLINIIPKSRPITLIFDQCYGGGMIEALWSSEGLRQNSCGFAAATRYEVAYNGGGFAKALFKLKSKEEETPPLTQAFQNLKRGPQDIGLTTKSTPVSTSDLFYNKYISNHVTQSSSPVTFNISPRDCLHSQEKLIPGISQDPDLGKMVQSQCNDLLAAVTAFGKKGMMDLDYTNAFERIQGLILHSEKLRAKIDQVKTELQPNVYQWVKATFPVLNGTSASQIISLEQVLNDSPLASSSDSAGTSSLMTANSWGRQLSRLAFENLKSQFQAHLSKVTGSGDALDRLASTKTEWESSEKELKLEKLFLSAFTNYVGLRTMTEQDDQLSVQKAKELFQCENSFQ